MYVNKQKLGSYVKNKALCWWWDSYHHEQRERRNTKSAHSGAGVPL